MKLPTLDVHDEGACYEALVNLLHPQGLACPGCGRYEGWYIHRRYRAPVLDYRCPDCRSIFNAWTGTILSKTHLPPSVLWQLVVAVVKRQSLAEVVRATGRPRSSMAIWQRRLRRFVREPMSTSDSGRRRLASGE